MMQSFRQPRLEDFFFFFLFFFYYCCTQLFTRKTVTEIAVLRVKTVEILAPRQSGSITAWSGREYWTFGCRKTYRKKHLFFSVDGGGFQSYLPMLNRRLLPDHVVTVCVAATRLLSRGQRLKRGNKLYDEHKLRLSDPTSQLLTLNSSYSDPPSPKEESCHIYLPLYVLYVYSRLFLGTARRWTVRGECKQTINLLLPSRKTTHTASIS